MRISLLISFVILSFYSIQIQAQNTYQKVYGVDFDTQCFGLLHCSDDGVISVGIASPNGSVSYISKMDCTGKVLWTRTFEFSSTVDNIFHRAIETKDGSIVFATNFGTYLNYSINLIKLDSEGNVIWHKLMKATSDDKVADIIETDEEDLILVGSTHSYGSDKSNSSSYKDIYLSKLNAEGDLIWSKTIGNPLNIDEATAIAKSSDGNFLITGRFIDQGAFFALLLKINTDGEVLLLKTFGAENHRNYGFDVFETKDKKYLITGGTTLNKENHQSYMDVFLIKTDTEGEIIWSKTYTANVDDRSDIGTSIIETPIEQYAVACQTLSYPTSGFVPNKHLLLLTDPTGYLLKAKTFNDGSSHYTYISPSQDGETNFISGFSNNATSTFSTHIIRMNNNFESGCNETDRTTQTTEELVEFEATTPEYEVQDGGNWIDSEVEAFLELDEQVICASIGDSICNPISQVFALEKSPLPLSIFPNPANNLLSIHWNNRAESIKQLLLIDQQGRFVMDLQDIEMKANQEKIIDVSQIPNGIYILRLASRSNVYHAPIIILH